MNFKFTKQKIKISLKLISYIDIIFILINTYDN